MKNLFQLLLLTMLVGCTTAPEEKETSAKPVKGKAPALAARTTYALREMGVTIEVPAGAEYVNWSTSLFTVLAHPMSSTPASANDYGATIEGSRVPSEKIAKMVVGKDESQQMQAWLNQFHPKLATESEKGFTYVRKDLLMSNGDVFCMRATIRSSPQQEQDTKFAKRVISSVKESKGDR